MAGDWIKIEHATPRKPEVYQIAGEIGVDADAAVGLLIKFWVWVSENMSEKCPKVFGHLSMIDTIVGRTGFGQAVVNAGWLAVDGDRIWIPNYDEHLSESAKKRAEDAKRKRLERKMSEDCPENVRKMSGKKRTKVGPEKRREENSLFIPDSDSVAISNRSAATLALPASLDIPEFREAWEVFLEHRRSIKKPLRPLAIENQLKVLVDWVGRYGIEEVCRSIQATVANQWQGLFEPKPRQKPRTGATLAETGFFDGIVEAVRQSEADNGTA